MKQFAHRWRLRLAMTLARIELHRVTFRQRDGRREVVKRRSLLGSLLIPPGNLYLKLLGAKSYVLSTTEWHRWELLIAGASISGNSVVTAVHTGQTLGAILQSELLATKEKLLAVKLAVLALTALHERSTELGNERAWSLSHGDATVENVVVDLAQQNAGWFDFDMRHRTLLSAIDRHTDDVRCLLFSSAALLPVSCYDELADLCLSHVSRRIVGNLRTLLSNQRRPTTFELAQAPLSFADTEALRTAIKLVTKSAADDKTT